MVKLIKLGNDRKPMLDEKGAQITQSFTNDMANTLLQQKYPYWAPAKDAEAQRDEKPKEEKPKNP